MGVDVERWFFRSRERVEVGERRGEEEKDRVEARREGKVEEEGGGEMETHFLISLISV